MGIRLFGQDIQVHFKVRVNKKRSPYLVDVAVQQKVLGSSSQYLEDVFIDSIFRGKKDGTYVDIGANDPSELSNTKRFYDRGWRGVNVEPDVRMYRKICTARPEDVNLNLGIGGETGELTFYELDPNTLSTFVKESAQLSVKKEGARIVSETKVQVISLADLLKNHAAGRTVDFLSVDAEGYEVAILSSNDWERYRPVSVMVEVNQDKKGSVNDLLKQQGYLLVYYNGTNGIYVDGRSELIRSYLGQG